jgi:hypothetical protein
MNPQDDYSYETSGFDGFLNRSIDGASQTNLDEQGPMSTQNRQDSAQVSGKAGDVWRIGQTQLDQSGVKVARPGVAIENAEDHQIIFNSSTNGFKVVATIKVSCETSESQITDQMALFPIQNPLGRLPDRIEGYFYVTHVPGVRYQLPWSRYNQSAGAFATLANSVAISSFDDTTINLDFRVFNIFGLAWSIGQRSFTVVLHLMDQTNPPD